MSLSRFFVAAALATAVPALADAAIVQTFSSRADFIAGTAGATSISFNFGDSGDIAPSFTIGGLTATAVDGGVYGVNHLLSTELDNDTLILSFASPIKAVGLLGGVADESSLYLNGSLLLTAIGSGSATLAASGGAAGYLGLLSDIGFTQLTVQISAFDLNATSAPFVMLEQQVDLAGSSAVPEPGIWAQMLVGFLLLGTALRGRRNPVSQPARG